jgi:hypothetical protein
MRIRRLALLALIALLGLAAWSAVAHPWAWLYAIGLHPYPASSGTPWTYQLWSGFMPALTVLTLLGSVATLYHLHKCHYDACWRLGKHRISGTPWCRRHMDSAGPRVTVEQLLETLVDRMDVLIGELTSRREP